MFLPLTPNKPTKRHNGRSFTKVINFANTPNQNVLKIIVHVIKKRPSVRQIVSVKDVRIGPEMRYTFRLRNNRE